MSKNKKTRPDTAIPEREKMGAEPGRETTSTADCTTAGETRQTGIAELLSHGAENAITLKHLKQMVDLPGREIRRQIQMEREQHVPIVSDRHGYYLAATTWEKERFVCGMKRRANEIIKVAEAVEKAKIGGE